MSLQMQFDDLVRKVDSMDLLCDEHDDYLADFVVESAEWKRKFAESQRECAKVKATLESKRREAEEARAKIQKQSAKLEVERERILELEKENSNLERVLATIREVILGGQQAREASDLLSMLGDIRSSSGCSGISSGDIDR